jgi:hypothetical protein
MATSVLTPDDGASTKLTEYHGVDVYCLVLLLAPCTSIWSDYVAHAMQAEVDAVKPHDAVHAITSQVSAEQISTSKSNSSTESGSCKLA